MIELLLIIQNLAKPNVKAMLKIDYLGLKQISKTRYITSCKHANVVQFKLNILNNTIYQIFILIVILALKSVSD
ncbi:hypothetical protein UACE39S_05240 [Ureibacillus acetophenoni]